MEKFSNVCLQTECKLCNYFDKLSRSSDIHRLGFCQKIFDQKMSAKRKQTAIDLSTKLKILQVVDSGKMKKLIAEEFGIPKSTLYS